jgi:hypothetical protein
MSDLALGHDSRPQERADQAENFGVSNPSSHSFHKAVVVDVIETCFDVPFDHSRHMTSTFPVRRHVSLYPSERIKRASTSSKPIRARKEIRLEYGFQDDFERHLHQSIAERWNTQWPELAWFPRFWDKFLPHGLGYIPSRAQILPKPF